MHCVIQYSVLTDKARHSITPPYREDGKVEWGKQDNTPVYSNTGIAALSGNDCLSAHESRPGFNHRLICVSEISSELLNNTPNASSRDNICSIKIY